MHRNEQTSAQESAGPWIVAGLAFAILAGLSLSIPLANGMSTAPTGYGEAVSATGAGRGAGAGAVTVIEKTMPGDCTDCAVSRQAVPSASEHFADPLVVLRRPADVEV